MQTAKNGAGLALVSDGAEDLKARGAAIKMRRLAAGIPTPNAWAERTGMDRTTIGKVERGEASVGSVERLEAWLDAWDLETGSGQAVVVDEASASEVRAADFMELEVTIDAVGLHIIGKGNSTNMDQVRKQIRDLYREIRGRGEE